MKITDIRTLRLRAPLGVQGQVESRTGVRTHRYAFLVEVHTDEGVTGVGSCSGNGLVLESIVAHVLKPLLVGMDPLAIEEIWDKAYFRAGVRAFGSRGVGVVALSGVDIALWDIAGKVKRAPVYELLGGKIRDRVEVYATALYPEETEAAVKKAEALARRGFHGIKIKVGFDLAQDIEIVTAVRSALGSGLPAHDRCQHGLRAGRCPGRRGGLREAQDSAGWRSRCSWKTWPAMPQLKARTGVPVALGENLHTRFAFESFMARDAVDVLQPDVARAGGISEVRTIAAAAAERGLPISLHTYGDGIALAASLHLAAALDNSAVMEFDYNENPLRSHLLQEPLEPDNGFMQPPDAPGLGVTLDPEALRTLPLRRRRRPRAMASDLARRGVTPGNPGHPRCQPGHSKVSSRT